MGIMKNTNWPKIVINRKNLSQTKIFNKIGTKIPKLPLRVIPNATHSMWMSSMQIED